MNPETLHELLQRQPFAPFRIRLSNQQTVDILNPALVVVLKREIFVAEPSREGFHIYALMHIVAVEPLLAA